MYLCQDSIIRYKNQNVPVISQGTKPGSCDFYEVDSRVFVIYLDDENICSIGEIKSDDTLVDTGIKWITLGISCDFYETSDKQGTVFFGSSDYGSSIHYIKTNDQIRQISIPNSMFIFGLTTSDNGSLWILGQDLYLVPFGQTEAQKIAGLPYMEQRSPFKAKPGTNDVFIGSDDGLYIGTL